MRARDEIPPEITAMRARLGEFLRQRREHLDAAELGITSRWRRRHSYPTQVEFSQLARIDRRTYQALEAGDGRCTEAVLSLVATAMRLSPDETIEMYALGGIVSPDYPVGPPAVRALTFVTAFSPTPAWVVDQTTNVIALNDAMAALLPGLADAGNVLKWMFGHPQARRVQVDYEEAARSLLAWLRVSRGRMRPGPVVDQVDALVADLCRSSPLARRLWVAPLVVPIGWRHRLRTTDGIVNVSFGTMQLGPGMDGLTAMYRIDVEPGT